MKPWVGFGLLLGGAALAGVGAVSLYRNRRNTNLGDQDQDQLPAPSEAAPIVGVDQAGGMTLTHRRHAEMPIEMRVRSIQDLVWKSVRDPRMRKIALAVTRHCPERDGKCEAEAIYQAMKKRIRYTGDIAPVKMGAGGPIEGIDLFQSAYRTWEFGGGDCDDHATLASTLLALNGITPRLRVTASSKRGDWEHILAGGMLPKNSPSKFYALDTTLPGNKRFGYEVPSAKKMDFPA
jgi:hypothetical protein